jgi:hypothetical protein
MQSLPSSVAAGGVGGGEVLSTWTSGGQASSEEGAGLRVPQRRSAGAGGSVEGRGRFGPVCAPRLLPAEKEV